MHRVCFCKEGSNGGITQASQDSCAAQESAARSGQAYLPLRRLQPQQREATEVGSALCVVSAHGRVHQTVSAWFDEPILALDAICWRIREQHPCVGMRHAVHGL